MNSTRAWFAAKLQEHANVLAHVKRLFLLLEISLVIGLVQIDAQIDPSYQDDIQMTPEEEEAIRAMGEACGGCAGCGCGVYVFILIVAIALLVVNILLLIWVASDSKARGESPALWVLLIFFTGLIGLLVYVIARPQGSLMRCQKCGNNRLQASRFCPQCGND